jgi:B9 domain-containing protein 1
MTVVMYGYDFFGRSVAKAYGNIHLPLNSGTVKRKIRTFKMSQTSVWNRLLAFCSGVEYEFKEVEKVLKDENQRASLRVQTSG